MLNWRVEALQNRLEFYDEIPEVEWQRSWNEVRIFDVVWFEYGVFFHGFEIFIRGMVSLS